MPNLSLFNYLFWLLTQVYNNTALSSGGGVDIQGSRAAAELHSTVLLGNRAPRGAGSHSGSGGTVKLLDGSLVQGGSANYGGAHLSEQGSHFHCESARIEDNSATADGGALYSSLLSKVLVQLLQLSSC